MEKRLEDRLYRRLLALARNDGGRLRRYLRVTEASEQKARRQAEIAKPATPGGKP